MISVGIMNILHRSDVRIYASIDGTDSILHIVIYI